MKNNDMRSMLRIMREFKQSTTSLIKEEDSQLDETTLNSIKELFIESIIVENIFITENKKELTVDGEILSLNIRFNMVIKPSINQSDCTVDFRNMVETSTVFNVDLDFVESLNEISKLYDIFKELHNYTIKNNVLEIEDTNNDQD